jgi:flagellar basal-body rod protein FlgF
MQAFRAVPVRGEGATTRAYVLESTIGHDTRPGAMQATGRSLDVAAQGNAWFAVQSLDGTEAYTRAGALEVDAQGQIVAAVRLVDPDGTTLARMEIPGRERAAPGPRARRAHGPSPAGTKPDGSSPWK